MKNVQKIAIVCGMFVSLVALGLFMYEGQQNTTLSTSTGSGHAIYAFDVGDPRQVIGAYHNVFVIKVGKHLGNKSRLAGGEKQFEGGVIYNVKGNLNGKVVLNQAGRSEASDLKIGSTYLVLTRYEATEDWYTVGTFPRAVVLISEDSRMRDD